MKLFRNAALAAAAFLLLSCQSLPAGNELGSRDRSRVELLANGKAKAVDVYTFNDFHATLAEDVTLSIDPALQGKNPGIGKFVATVKSLREINPNSVFLSGGDMYQGSALSVLTKGGIMSQELRELGLAASAVGNHEFDWGDGNFELWSVEGGFPFLAANLVDASTGEVPAWALPYTILTVGGHRIAVLGLVTGETLSTVKRENVQAYEFRDAAETAREWVQRIRRTEKPEALIVLTHIPAVPDKIDSARAVSPSALDELDKLALVRGIDAIVTGHSHSTVNGKTNGVPVVQAYYNGRSLAKLSFTFREDGTFSLSTSLVELYKNKATIREDANARAIFDAGMAKYADILLEKVAEVKGNLTHESGANVTPMGYWVSEAMRKRFNTQVAVTNGGGLRKGFVEGVATVQDFWDLMPFDNTAITFKVSGAVLRKIIDHGIDSPGMGNGQFSGLVVRYDPSRPYEGKIVSMTLADGTPVTDDGIYSVVTNDFIFLTGGDGYVMMPANDPSAFTQTFVPIRDVLIKAAKEAGTITAVTPAVLLPASR